MQKEIFIKGARENNLKNIDVTIPRDKLVVLTGLSGSGKSSLAFDTIYAEGQRRYVESLSSYARMFLGQMDKPDVDYIDGLSPAISIDQKTTSKNPRSTVGTVTEIYDYLRLLWARVGVPHCPKCGREIRQQTVDQIIDQIMALPEGTRIQVMSPVVRGRKGEHAKVLEDARRSGYVRARVDGNLYELSEDIPLEKNLKHHIDIVVDRLIVRPDIAQRLTDSVETASNLSGGLVTVNLLKEQQDITFSQNYACEDCGISIEELTPRLFSFNSPFGACPTCTGLGVQLKADPALIVPDESKSILDGAITAPGWASIRSDGVSRMYFEALSKKYQFSLRQPYSELSDAVKQVILYGTGGEKLELHYDQPRGKGVLHQAFEGICHNLERRYNETQSEASKKEIEEYLSQCPCPACKGRRLRPEALAVTVGGLSIFDATELPVDQALPFFNALELTGNQQLIAAQILKEIRARLGFLQSVGLSYLTLSRASGTLSGGESQRIRLATQIGSSLMGVLYILDEPSIGLHQRDNDKLLATLCRLRDLGNTLIVVEHDEDTMRAADWLIDIGPGADVDEPVGGAHGVLVMLHHDQGVAQIPEAAQRGQQLVVVPLVQADGRLIQNIQHAHETAADLGGQTDTLALAAGQCAGGTGQSEIAQSHGLQKAQPRPNFLEDLGGNELLVARQLQSIEEGQCLVYRQLRGIKDGQTSHRHRQRLRPQTAALAGGTGTLGQVLLDLLFAGFALRLVIPPLQIVADALKRLMQHALATGLVVVQLQLLAAGAIEDDLLHRVAELAVRLAQGELILLAQRLEIHPADAIGADGGPAGSCDSAVQNGLALVRHDQRRVGLQLNAQPCTGGAGAEGTVEGEQAGRQLLDGDAAVLAGVVLGKGDVLLLLQQVHRHQSAGQIGRRLHGVRQALGDIGADNEPVHHDVDMVLQVLLQRDILRQLVEVPVHAGADVAAAAGVLQHLGVFTLAAPHHRRHHLDAGTLRQGHDLVDDLVHRLLADLPAALGAVGHAHPRPQQAEVVVDLRHRAHGGAGVLAGGLLVDGDGGGQAVDIVHVGLVHLAQEHAGVGAEALHIPALAFGVDGVEGQRAFPAAAEARQHHQLVPGDGDVNIFQVVLAGALDENFLLHGIPLYTILHDDIRCFCPQQGNEVAGAALHLRPDLPCADADGIVLRSRGVEHRGELLLHAHGAAPAVDVARQTQQLLLGQHGHGLLSHGPGSLLQIKVLRHGDVEHIVPAGRTLRHQCLEHMGGVLPQCRRHGHAVNGAVRVVGVSGVGDLLLVQRAHHVGLFFFMLCHNRHLLRTRTVPVRSESGYGRDKRRKSRIAGPCWKSRALRYTDREGSGTAWPASPAATPSRTSRTGPAPPAGWPTGS